MKKRKGTMPSREERLGRDVIDRHERLMQALQARLDLHAKQLEERRAQQQH
jgi:hypothetical protein